MVGVVTMPLEPLISTQKKKNMPIVCYKYDNIYTFVKKEIFKINQSMFTMLS